MKGLYLRLIPKKDPQRICFIREDIGSNCYCLPGDQAKIACISTNNRVFSFYGSEINIDHSKRYTDEEVTNLLKKVDNQNDEGEG